MTVGPVTIINSSGNEIKKNCKYKMYLCGSFLTHSKCFDTLSLL